MSEQEEGLDFSFVLASSVHDMKNSLGMLLNSIEVTLAESPPQDEVQKKHFDTLQYEALRINSELIQLLSIYRMQHDRLPLQIDENYVSDTLAEQLARNDMLFTSKDISVDICCDEDLVWYFDGELVGGVIHNILVNGARYTREKIKVSAEQQGDYLCVSVSDDGGGYPPSMLDALTQTNMGVSFSSGSTNLGLFFADKVAAMHREGERRGYIKLENGGAYGGGVFKIYIP